MLPADSIRDKHHCSSLGITNSRHGNYRTWASSSLPPVRHSALFLVLLPLLFLHLEWPFLDLLQCEERHFLRTSGKCMRKQTRPCASESSSSSIPNRASQCQMFVKLLTSDTELCPERMSVHPEIASARWRSKASPEGRVTCLNSVTLKWMGRLLWNEPLGREDWLADTGVRSIRADSYNNLRHSSETGQDEGGRNQSSAHSRVRNK